MNKSSCIYPELVELLQQHKDCVLATVVSTLGSTPQKAGNSALIGENGLMAGTVGGGMTELKVIQHAQLLLKTKKSGLFSFELRGEIAKGSDSICGGSMTILLDALPELHLEIFTQLKDSLDRRQKGILLTLNNAVDLDDLKIKRYWVLENDQSYYSEMNDNIRLVISKMFLNAHSDSICTVPFDRMENLMEGFGFAERILPKPSLIIAGAGHIGQSLVRLGRFLGFEVTVWDDRPEYADQTRFPDADGVLSGLESLENFSLRNDFYLVIVTRGHKSDADVLRKFIDSKAAYIGMIGSKAKVAQMKLSFLENGWATPEQWNRIFTPVGLDIGAQTIEEIAISIAAQLVKVRNQRIDNNE